METLPEPQDPIKPFLSWCIVDQEHVARYSDLSYVLETIKKGERSWQAAVSIGVHALVLGVFGKTGDEKALAESLAPMEALHESLTRQAGQQPLTDEQARMLFHIRFALGFLFLAKGERETAKRFLHDMAATKLSRHGGGWGYRSGGDVVAYSEDMGRAKDLTASVMLDVYMEAEDYEEALCLIAEAADTTGDRLHLLPHAADLLNGWAAKCDRIEQQESWYPQWLEWSPLLLSAMRVLEVCPQADTSGAPPSECDKGSAQFLAYKFGQLAARFAVKFAPDYMAEPLVDEASRSYDGLLHALLCEHAICSDWQKAREAFVWAWGLTPCCSGIPPEEIGPHTDLHWAMRIGFADKMLESTGALEVTVPGAMLPKPIGDAEGADIADAIASRVAQELRRHWDERLPPSPRQLRERVIRQLVAVADVIPLRVVNHLEKAERYYERRVNDDEAKVSFVKAVEAALHDSLDGPLVAFMKQYGLQQMGFPLPPPRNRIRATSIATVKLLEWADVLDRLVAPARNDLSALGAQDLKRFMHQHVGSHLPDFAPLARSLRRVQELRAGSAHYQGAETRLDKEQWELEEMRKLVLGVAGSPSVIAQIYRLLAPTDQS